MSTMNAGVDVGLRQFESLGLWRWYQWRYLTTLVVGKNNDEIHFHIEWCAHWWESVEWNVVARTLAVRSCSAIPNSARHICLYANLLAETTPLQPSIWASALLKSLGQAENHPKSNTHLLGNLSTPPSVIYYRQCKPPSKRTISNIPRRINASSRHRLLGSWKTQPMVIANLQDLYIAGVADWSALRGSLWEKLSHDAAFGMFRQAGVCFFSSSHQYKETAVRMHLQSGGG